MDQPFWEMKTDGEVSQLILEMEQQSDDGHRSNKIVTILKLYCRIWSEPAMALLEYSAVLDVRRFTVET